MHKKRIRWTPIIIRSVTGRATAMGPDAMKLVGGALCLITVEVSKSSADGNMAIDNLLD